MFVVKYVPYRDRNHIKNKDKQIENRNSENERTLVTITTDNFIAKSLASKATKQRGRSLRSR